MRISQLTVFLKRFLKNTRAMKSRTQLIEAAGIAPIASNAKIAKGALLAFLALDVLIADDAKVAKAFGI